MASGIGSALWDTLPDDSWAQATLAVDAGGLGMREAGAIALPAFLASRVVSRPLVAEMAQHTEDAGLCSSALSLQAYDARTAAAWGEWLCTLPAAVHDEARKLMEDAAEVASTRWRRLCAGDEETTVPADGPGPAAAPAAGNLVSAVGTEDVEHPGPPQGQCSPSTAGPNQDRGQMRRCRASGAHALPGALG